MAHGIILIITLLLLKGHFSNYNTSTTQGTLFIDIIDYKKNELVWQGIGKGYISEKTSKKEEQIKSFVNKILLQYPVK